jgi:hypothetical protein
MATPPPPTELERVRIEIESINTLQEKDFTQWTVVEKRKYGQNEEVAYERLREEKKRKEDKQNALIEQQNLQLQLQLQQQQASKNQATG